MTILTNSHMDEDRRKLVFLAGVCLSLANDFIEDSDPSTMEGRFDAMVGLTIREVVEAALLDADTIVTNPDVDDEDQVKLFYRINTLLAGVKPE